MVSAQPHIFSHFSILSYTLQASLELLLKYLDIPSAEEILSNSPFHHPSVYFLPTRIQLASHMFLIDLSNILPAKHFQTKKFWLNLRTDPFLQSPAQPCGTEHSSRRDSTGGVVQLSLHVSRCQLLALHRNEGFRTEK